MIFFIDISDSLESEADITEEEEHYKVMKGKVKLQKKQPKETTKYLGVSEIRRLENLFETEFPREKQIRDNLHFYLGFLLLTFQLQLY